MPLAQLEGKLPVVLDRDGLYDIGHQFVLFVVADQPGVAIDDEQAYILGPADQGAQFAALAANDFFTGHFHHRGYFRQPLIDAGQFTRGDFGREHGRFHISRRHRRCRRRCGKGHGARQQQGGAGFISDKHHISFGNWVPASART